MITIGSVDFGGTKIAVGAVQEDGRVVKRVECCTEPEKGFHHAPRTIGHIKQLMGRVYQFAIHRDLIPDTCNPVRKVKCSTESDYTAIAITPAQARAIFDQLRPPENLLLLLVTVTGLRCSEALGLKWSDIDPEAQAIFVRRSWTMDREGRPVSHLTFPRPVSVL